MGASLLRHIHIHVEKNQRMPKVLLWAGVQHQDGIVSRRGVWGSLVPGQTLPSVQRSSGAEARLQLRAQHPRGVRQDGQNSVRRTWTKVKEETGDVGDEENDEHILQNSFKIKVF